jgi:hypothetical protein
LRSAKSGQPGADVDGDLQHRDRPIADAGDFLDRILLKQEPAVSVAVIKFVIAFADEVAPAILGDGVGNGGDEGGQQRILAAVGDRLDVLLGAGQSDQIFRGHVGGLRRWRDMQLLQLQARSDGYD